MRINKYMYIGTIHIIIIIIIIIIIQHTVIIVRLQLSHSTENRKNGMYYNTMTTQQSTVIYFLSDINSRIQDNIEQNNL